MRPHARRTITSLSLVCAGALAAGLALAAPFGAAAAATSTALPSAGSTRTVTLITGERVAVSTDPSGRPAVTLVAGGQGPATDFQVLTTGTRLYVVPLIAADYLGAPLDLSLFDVSADSADGSADASAAVAPQLDVEYDAASHPALPGTTATGSGTLAVTDPAAFGRALANDQAARRRTGQAHGSLFNGVRKVSRPGPDGHPSPKPPTSAPAGRLYTVTVKVTDRLGQRVSGAIVVAMNADDIDSYYGAQTAHDGAVAFSVPAGHYSIDSYISTVHSDGSIDYTLAAAPEVDVARDTTVTVDARRGTRMAATVPTDAIQTGGQLNYQRNPASGVSFTDALVVFGDTALYATPTPAVQVGQLYFYPSLRLGDADGSLQHVVYDLAFPTVGAIPAELGYTVRADQLAAIDATYHSPVAGRVEYEARSGSMSWQATQISGASEVVAPARRTEYVLAQPGMDWLQEVALDGQDLFGYTEDVVRTYTAGEHTTADWTPQPSVPGINQESLVAQQCPACRVGDTLGLELFGFVDPGGHRQLPDPTMTQTMTLYQDGTQVAAASSGRASLPMSTSPASYQLVYDVSRDAPWWPSSTRTHTAWTFTSAERDPQQLPAGWTCPPAGGGGPKGLGKGGDGGAPAGCSIEPLLFTSYTTSAGPDDIIAAGGPATVDVAVSRQPGTGAIPIDSFAAQVSYNDGAQWTDVTATPLDNGRYRLSFTSPPLADTDGYASLHIVASAADSAIDQTITRAYPLTTPTPAGSGDGGTGDGGTGGGKKPPSTGQVRACQVAAPPYAQCMAIVNAAAGESADTPVGLSPADIQSAYRTGELGRGRTVAIVDAYDNPNAEADLAAYRAQYRLPACTTGNGCFRKVNQSGKAAPLPVPSTGWGLESSLDLDAVSATCPACRILLVEADSASTGDLLQAVLTAAKLGADAISNSYGTVGELSGEQTIERYYRDLRVPALFATGDYGYGNGAPIIGGISYPAASQYVVAVGGTSLVADDSARGWTETAWDGATSGCSAYIHKPGWQKDPLCGMRTIADLAAVADPATGLAVYDTFGYGGWLQVGGTSLATPIVASMYAAAGIRAQPGYLADLYRDRSALFDASGGSNGTNCSGTYLCTAEPGYDGPTGLGTPNGSARYWR